MEEISIISMLFTAILALGCLFLVSAPLLRWDTYSAVKSHKSISDNEKAVLLTTLNEIEFEYKMDKLSKKDYLELKKQYESQVANVIKKESKQDDTEADPDLLEEVEREIQQAMLKYKKTKGES
jgi:hypothetical protein